MTSVNNPKFGTLGRECQRLEINANIGSPNGSPLTNVTIKRLRKRFIPVLPPIVFSRSSSLS